MIAGKEVVADSAGKFTVGPGRGIVVVPADLGAAYPLRMVRDGNQGDYLDIDDNRPMHVDPFQTLEAVGAVAGSKWRVWVLETADDALGTPSPAFARPVRLFASTWSGGANATGEYVAETQAAEGVLDKWTKTYDVSRYRIVMLRVSNYGVSSTSGVGAVSATLYDLTASDGSGGVVAHTLNFTASPADPQLLKWTFGEGINHATTANDVRRGDKLTRVAVRVSVTNTPSSEDVDFAAGDPEFELWGIP